MGGAVVVRSTLPLGRLIGNQGCTVHMYAEMLLGHILGLSPAGEFQIKNGMHLYSGLLSRNPIPKSIRRLLIHIGRPTMSFVVSLWHVAWIVGIFWIWNCCFHFSQIARSASHPLLYRAEVATSVDTGDVCACLCAPAPVV
jgi:hypothetical protein